MAKLTMWQEWKEANTTERLKGVLGLFLIAAGVFWFFDFFIPTYLHDILRLPSPPWETSFLGKIGWYAGYVYGTIENFFR